MEISRRPTEDSDQGFLRRLFDSVRAGEFAPLSLPPVQLEQLLAIQFEAQRRSYADAFPRARHLIVLLDGVAIGRTYVNVSDAAIVLVDISLLSEVRGRGIGARLLRDLQAEASALRRPLRLRVMRNNPARRLYHRMGFEVVSGDQLSEEMEWRPAHGEEHR